MFSYFSIKDFHTRLQQGTITCSNVVNHYLNEIEHKKNLNAFTEIFANEAIEKAAELDKKRAAGEPLKKLHGVVIAIKDVICYKDHHITAASGILKGFTSLYTASALQFLIDEDAIIIGACNCDEFAMGSTNENSVYGPALNALDPSKVPGGSSGGSAVAVQAGMCMVSLGSDTGGSVRQPADYCGIIGFKPGYGRISRYGLIAYASSFDQIGIFGTNMDDIELMISIMSKPDDNDSTMLQAPLNTAVKEEKALRYCLFKQVMEHPSLNNEIKEKINSIAEQLSHNGHKVDFIDFDLLDYIVSAYYVLTTAEASSNLSRYDGVRFGHRSLETADSIDTFYKNNRSEGFGLEVKRRIMLGTFVLSSGYYDAYFSKAQQVRNMLVENVKNIFSQYDVILMPTSPTTAPTIGDNKKDPVATYLADIFTVFANLTGIPAISIPLFHHSKDNMPFGLQLMANSGDEVTLLQTSKKLLKQYRQAEVTALS
ncbi:MAG: Asp-tRNA(Asn)/Glu-tRNA(Gln) amidotransferase subunit GatA [Bacteroidetes bacterium]|nr:Asp-tRNA(Asn)/Glu-tRNA(Gln) amidotransferase subunit GatA [Bacteroidota bacterium]MBS1758443.1 Asp-tRNA(Asn)/Glu-tRNA(Gln) amidotransferase subunit GatA [Bacteroidota bacterium]